MKKRSGLFGMMYVALAVMVGIFISAFSFGASTVHAQEPVATEQTADEKTDANAENSGGAIIVLMGGMLLIIIAVVVTVVATVVSTAPIADEI